MLEQERISKSLKMDTPDFYCKECGGAFFELNRDGLCPYCGDY